jgi:hypothetical protein
MRTGGSGVGNPASGVFDGSGVAVTDGLGGTGDGSDVGWIVIRASVVAVGDGVPAPPHPARRTAETVMIAIRISTPSGRLQPL